MTIKVKIKNDKIIEFLKKNRKTSYKDMGETLGLAASTVWKIETGKLSSVKVALIMGVYAVGNPLYFLEIKNEQN